ncbi:MAG: hypothetical protein INQ03_04575 [Candidatus Heimdallarchaeota archaeon]|nr:hypothetical protein [Candidatus Heimdallarchaeota archaeon]
MKYLVLLLLGLCMYTGSAMILNDVQVLVIERMETSGEFGWPVYDQVKEQFYFLQEGDELIITVTDLNPQVTYNQYIFSGWEYLDFDDSVELSISVAGIIETRVYSRYTAYIIPNDIESLDVYFSSHDNVAYHIDGQFIIVDRFDLIQGKYLYKAMNSSSRYDLNTGWLVEHQVHMQYNDYAMNAILGEKTFSSTEDTSTDFSLIIIAILIYNRRRKE